MTRFVKACLVVAWPFLAAGPLAGGETLSLPEFGLKLTVPDDFVPAPPLVRGDVVAAFQRPAADGRQLPTVILVSRLNDTLGRDAPVPAVAAATNRQATIFQAKWKEFDIFVSRLPERSRGVETLALKAQVPLKFEAVQLVVFGEADQEAELQALLPTVLATLEGKSNWLTTREQDEAIGEGIGSIVLTIMVIVAVVSVARNANGVRNRKRRRRPVRATLVPEQPERDTPPRRAKLIAAPPDPDRPPSRRAKLIADRPEAGPLPPRRPE